MSRIGKIPVDLPSGVKVNQTPTSITLEGSKGSLSLDIPHGIEVKQEDNTLVVSRTSEAKQARASYGTVRALLQNMVVGVTEGHKKDLEIQGLGFRAENKGNKIVLNLGLSHPVEFESPEDVKVEVAKNQTNISVEGIDKSRVGLIASKIRGIKPPEPYKGKGIRYVGEVVRRKQGKSVGK